MSERLAIVSDSGSPVDGPGLVALPPQDGCREDVQKAQPAIQPAAHSERAIPVARDLNRPSDGRQAPRCAFCGHSLAQRRRHARYCSAPCRAAASDLRRGKRVNPDRRHGRRGGEDAAAS